METFLSTLFVALPLIGLLDSLVFAWSALTHREAEVTCKDGSCLRLSRTKYAKVFFGIPNWVFGIIFYTLILLAFISGNNSLIQLSLIGSVIAFVFSCYLIWSLVIKLRVMCKLCYLAHVVNIGLFLTWIAWIYLLFSGSISISS